METNKTEIIAAHNEKTYQSYKHKELLVGDVWQNTFGVKGIVTFKLNDDGIKKYYFCKTNGAEHSLPENKAGFNDGEYVGNVCDDAALMEEFIKIGLIIDDSDTQIAPPPPVVEEVVAEVEQPKEEKPKTIRKKAAKKVEPVKEKEEENTPETKDVHKISFVDKETAMKTSLLVKINAVRAAWSKANIEKEGLGRAGGNSKYEYYKPQQVIDFCLKEEIKNNLFSEFDTIRNDEGLTTACYYKVTDIETGETKLVSCPFEVPTKMACSQAQQVGAALTYYNRRLAMLMYKIEDNSKESVNVLEDADYTAQNAPEIPAPSIVPPAPVPTPPAPPVQQTENIVPTVPPINIKAEMYSKPTNESPVQDEITAPPIQEETKIDSVPAENEQKAPAVTAPKVETPKVEIPTPPAPPASPITKQITPPPTQAAAPENQSTAKRIEDLY